MKRAIETAAEIGVTEVTKLKTIDLLNLLPGPYNKQAIENVRSQHADYLDFEHRKEIGANIVASAFVWDKSPEGWQYWRDLFDKLLKDPIEIPD